MFLRLVSVLLVTVSVNPWDTVGFTETTRVRNELIGPVRSVTIKKQGYSTVETYDRAGHLIEAVLDLTHANTGTHSFFQYNQDGHLQEEVAFDQRGRIIYRKHVIYARDPEGRDTASVTASDDGHFSECRVSRSMTNEVISGNSLSVSSTTGVQESSSTYRAIGFIRHTTVGEKLLNELKTSI